MPLPMVHLSVAHHLAERYDYPSSPAFYLGSIAPDAIHKRPDTDRPDKLDVHLIGPQGLDEGRLRAFLAQQSAAAGYAADIATGYAGHILTDVCWREDVLLPFRGQFEERLQRNEMPVAELRALYYAECDRVDLDLYDQQPWRPKVWALLREASMVDLEGLLSADEIAGWRDRVLGWFEDNRDKAIYTPKYITLEHVLAFIENAAERVHRFITPISQLRS